ncbi:hypothetical protein D3C72_1929380 [compost metagenome]
MLSLVLEAFEDQRIEWVVADRVGEYLAQQTTVAAMQSPGMAIQALQLSVLLFIKQPGQQRQLIATAHAPFDEGACDAW